MTAPRFRYQSPTGEIVDCDTFLQRLEAGNAMLAGPFRHEIVGVTSDGDRVALEMTGEVPLVNGMVYRNRYHMLFELEGGLIASWREYCDTHALDVFLVPTQA